MVSCPWQLGVAADHEACLEHQHDWYERALPALRPNIIVLVHEPDDDPAAMRTVRLPNGIGRTSDPRIEAGLIKASANTLNQLTDHYPRIVILEPIPDDPLDPLSCLSTGKSSDQCSYEANMSPTPLERFYRSRNNHKNVWVIDLDRLVCPRFPKCDAIVNSIIVKRDQTHLTGRYSASLGPELNKELHQQGAL